MAQPPVACSRCGTPSLAAEDGLAPGWSLSSDERGLLHLCADCTRSHARDIEAKLPDQWWDQGD